MGDSEEMGGMPAGTGGMQNGTPGWAVAAGRRQARRLALRGPKIKHGLIAAPHIQHPRDNKGPSFGLGGGFKAGGF